MTDTTSNHLAPARGSGFMGIMTAIGETLALASEAGRRVRRVEALNDLTDDELAARGLKREQIVHHVFRDLYYI